MRREMTEEELYLSRLRRERSERDRIHSALLGGARPRDLDYKKVVDSTRKRRTYNVPYRTRYSGSPTVDGAVEDFDSMTMAEDILADYLTGEITDTALERALGSLIQNTDRVTAHAILQKAKAYGVFGPKYHVDTVRDPSEYVYASMY